MLTVTNWVIEMVKHLVILKVILKAKHLEIH